MGQDKQGRLILIEALKGEVTVNRLGGELFHIRLFGQQAYYLGKKKAPGALGASPVLSGGERSHFLIRFELGFYSPPMIAMIQISHTSQPISL